MLKRGTVLLVVLLEFASAILAVQTATSANAPYAPLWLYKGNWQISSKNQGAGAKPDHLTNECALVGKYFACQQTINGSLSALLVLLPAKTTGTYYTQSIMPDGRAGGLGELAIDGNKWAFSSTWNQGGGKTTHYKTINVFTGKDRIHFEQQESDNNQDWKTTNSGDEVRSGKAK